MSFIIWFIVNSIMLGVGLAMDAFSVSLANGFVESCMTRKRKLFIAGIYAFFQFIMPVIGWFLVHNAASFFTGFQRFIPWIALILLAYIGGKMLLEGIKEGKCESDGKCESCPNKECARFGMKSADRQISFKTLIVQGIATSIDALSVGFTIVEYNAAQALLAGLIIAVVTYIICYSGLVIGTRFGTRLSGRAKVLGGVILIAIGLEIFIKSFL